MGRAPLRATPIRETVSETAAPKKTRLRKGAAARSLLDLPNEIVAAVRDQYGQDLQWVTDSVLGQAAPQARNAFEINAWEAVTPDMFGGIFDGMYTRKGYQGEIIYDGLVLMYRPYELTVEANAEDERARNDAMRAQQNMIKGGVIPGLASGFESQHPSALAGNTFNRTVKPPMDIPTD